MKIAINAFVLFLGFTKELVWGCSLMPPCGLNIESLSLTDTPGIVHIDIGKYDPCPNDFTTMTYGDIEEIITLEVDYNENIVRGGSGVEKFVAAVPENDLYGLNQPTVDQTLYELNLESTLDGSEYVTAKGTIFGLSSTTVGGGDFDDLVPFVTLHLPGFHREGYDDFSLMYDGVISFYSEKFQRFYVLYENIEERTTMVSCPLDEMPKDQGGKKNMLSCSTSYPKISIQDIDKSGQEVLVYDNSQMVGLPVVCCLCVSRYYYVFDESTIVRKIRNLSGMGTEIDTRIDTSYVNGGGYSGDVSIDVTVKTTSRYGSEVVRTEKMNAAINAKAKSLLFRTGEENDDVVVKEKGIPITLIGSIEGSNPKEVTSTLLRDYFGSLSIQNVAESSDFVYEGMAEKASTYRFRQVYKDVVVYDGYFDITLNKMNQVTDVEGIFIPDVFMKDSSLESKMMEYNIRSLISDKYGKGPGSLRYWYATKVIFQSTEKSILSWAARFTVITRDSSNGYENFEVVLDDNNGEELFLRNLSSEENKEDGSDYSSSVRKNDEDNGEDEENDVEVSSNQKPTCSEVVKGIKENPNVTAAFLDLVEKVGESRTDQKKPLQVETIQLYNKIDDNDVLIQNAKSACARVGYDYCEVDSTTKIKNTAELPGTGEELNVEFITKEMRKPVCFPKSCGNEAVDIVYPNPSRCNEALGCKVVKQKVNKCNNREVLTTTDDDACASDVLPWYSQFNRLTSRIEANVLQWCAKDDNNDNDGITDGENDPDLCVGPEFGTYDIVSRRNFTEVMAATNTTTPSFGDIYQQTCEQAGGVTCRVDARATFTIPIPPGLIGHVSYKAILTGMPTCLPATTCNFRQKQKLAENQILSLLNDHTMVEQCYNENVDITNNPGDLLEEAIEGVAEEATDRLENVTGAEELLETIPLENLANETSEVLNNLFGEGSAMVMEAFEETSQNIGNLATTLTESFLGDLNTELGISTSCGGKIKILSLICDDGSDSSAPTSFSLAPTSFSLAPTSNSSAPTSNYSAPTSNSSAPTSNSSAPTSNSSAPTSNSSAPTFFFSN